MRNSTGLIQGFNPAPARLPKAGSLARILRRKLRERRPVERLAAVSQQGQEPIAQQAGEGQGHAQGFRRRQGQADVLLSQGRGEGRRLELLSDDQIAISLINRGGKEGRGQKIEIMAAIDTRLAEELSSAI